MVAEVTKLNEEANSEFDRASYRIEFLTKQRNTALDSVVLANESLQVAQLELRKAYARIESLLPLIEKAGTTDQQPQPEVPNVEEANPPS